MNHCYYRYNMCDSKVVGRHTRCLPGQAQGGPVSRLQYHSSHHHVGPVLSVSDECAGKLLAMIANNFLHNIPFSSGRRHAQLDGSFGVTGAQPVV